MARKIIAGNWKMNHNLDEGLAVVKAVNTYVQKKELKHVEAVIATPFIHLAAAAKISVANRLSVAAQDCSAHESGAFTGEVSAAMLKSTGTELVLVGHSERRQFFKETDKELSGKIKQAWACGLLPIFCVGESLEQRQSGAHFKTVENQIKGALGGFSADALENMIIAYEPVWAIGTGETASPEQAQEMHNHIRNYMAQLHNATLAHEISLLYGGSVKPSNAKELFSQPDVDGGLIGGAALQADSFIELLEIGEAVLR
jgi:triosephosphate isomerase